MIPLRRCGSHALRLRLNFSPDFHAPYPLHIVDFMPLVELYGDLRDDAAYFQLIVDLVGLQTVSMVKWDGVVLDPVTLFDRLRDEPRSVHRAMWEMLFQSGRAHGARVVMDKSLDNVHYADDLLRLFGDDMLFLNVVRDPRAQIASMNRAIIHEFDTLLNADIWVQAHVAARRLTQVCPERVLTVRFEDFIANEEAVLRRICTFLGIEFLPDMLDVAHSNEALKISGLSALWESNASRPIAANVDKFRKLLSIEEIETIETLTGEYMDRYGYERMTPARAKIDATVRDQARPRSQQQREAAWRGLRERNFRDYALRRARADYLATVKERLLREPLGSRAANGDAVRLALTEPARADLD
jgi:hypothetical protein